MRRSGEHLDHARRDACEKTVHAFAEREILPHVDDWERTGELPATCTRRRPTPACSARPSRERGGSGGGRRRRGGDLRGVARIRRVREAFSHPCSPAGSPSRTWWPPAPTIRSNDSSVPPLAGKKIGDWPSPSPAAAPTWDTCGPGPTATATAMWSTAPRRTSRPACADYVVVTAVRTGGPARPGFPAGRREGHARASSHPPTGQDGLALLGHGRAVPHRRPGAGRQPRRRQDSGFLQIAAQRSSPERIGLAAQAYSSAQRCLELTVQWCRDRETFGRPLISRQSVQNTLAEMARRVDVASVTRAGWSSGSSEVRPT